MDFLELAEVYLSVKSRFFKEFCIEISKVSILFP